MTYAKNTHVSSERSKVEIEQLVVKHGATKFVCGWDGSAAVVIFEMKQRRIRFNLPVLDIADPKYRGQGTRDRSASQIRLAWEQDTRSRWRALLLVIKAKLESVERGVTSFEEEFLAHLVLPSGDTVGEWAIPLITDAYERGAKMPPLLPGAS